jgi:hypothetical protein
MDIALAKAHLKKKTTDPVVGGNYSNPRFIPTEDILFMPDADADNSAVITPDIILRDGKDYIHLYGTSDEFDFNENGSEGRDNDGAESKFDMFHPGSSDYMKWMINAYGGRPGVILFDEIATKKTIALGSIDIPANITWAFTSGKKKDDAKGYKLTFTREGFGSAPTYKGKGAKVAMSVMVVDGVLIDMSKGSRVLTQANTQATIITDISNPVIGSTLIIVGGSNVDSSQLLAANAKFDLSGGDWAAADGAELRLFIRGVDDYVELDRKAAV